MEHRFQYLYVFFFFLNNPTGSWEVFLLSCHESGCLGGSVLGTERRGKEGVSAVNM